MAENAVVELNSENFDKTVLQSEVPVIVDFWATWCGPCRMVSPIIDEVAEDFAGRAVVGKVNVDDNSDLAQQYSIVSIPTVLYFKNGEIVERVVGARPKEDFEEKLEAIL